MGDKYTSFNYLSIEVFFILKTNANLSVEKQESLETDRTVYPEFLQNHLKLVYFSACNHG